MHLVLVTIKEIGTENIVKSQQRNVTLNIYNNKRAIKRFETKGQIVKWQL